MDGSALDVASDSFKFPPEWQDDCKMNVMFSPFRPKSLDEIAWNTKLKFWESLIRSHCQFYKMPSFSVSTLKSAFSRNGRSPTCLETVVEELKGSKKIEPTETYSNYSFKPEPFVSWLVNGAISWAVHKVKAPFVSKPDPESTSYVFISVAKEIGDECLVKFKCDQRGKLMLLSRFNEIAGIQSSESVIILKQLILNKRIAVDQIGSEVVVKVAKDNEKVEPITEVDIGVFQLEQNEKKLQDNIDELEKEVDCAMEKVRTCLKTNRKQMAKSWLRRKKELDKYIEKRANALDNIRSLLEQLKQTESDAAVLQSYRLGLDALKKSMSISGLTEEKADTTLAELEDVLDVTKGIEETLARPLDASSDADLEQELESLLEEGEESAPGNSPGGSFNIQSLPDVPSTLDDNLHDRLKAVSM